MQVRLTTPPTTRSPESVPHATSLRWRTRALALIGGVIIVGFSQPLWDLFLFCWGSALYSHILLIPFISLYLIWLKRGELVFETNWGQWCAVVPLAIGTGMLALYWLVLCSTWRAPMEDYLAFMMAALLCFLLGCACLCLGLGGMRCLEFPLAFLVFMIPLPASLVEHIESFLQHGSAYVAHGLFLVFGTPVLREGMFFQLPGMSLHVAPECSGIHSSFVLFISSLLGGYVLLRTGWRRMVLALAVIPLAFLRNGFRIFVIGELCVNVSPDMIHSYIHRRGGPIFFALSLIPFFALLLLLRRSEEKTRTKDADPG